MRRTSSFAALVLVMLLAPAVRAESDHALDEAKWQDGESRAEPAKDEPPRPRVKASDLHPAHRVAAVAVALGPGAVVHGAGLSSRGRSDAARRVFLAEAAGLALAVGGTAGLAVTGASRYTVAPFATAMILGGSLFVSSWLADVYGTAAGDDRGLPLRLAPVIESSIGWRHVEDPQFRYHEFLVESFDLRMGRLRLAPSLWTALDDDNSRARISAGWRFAGPLPHAEGRDGSFVDAELGFTDHRYVSDGFSMSTGEAFVNGRIDLERIDHDLSGAFFEAGVGWALERIRYDIPGTKVPSDTEQLLLARTAFGVYLGRGRGEASFYYDHRHDGYAAGLHLTGLGSGVPGHLGVGAKWFSESGLGVLGEAEAGSAFVFGASLAYRQGGAP